MTDPQMLKRLEALVPAAKALNEASDALNATVAEIDAALKKLNIGVACFHPIPDCPHLELGYARVEKLWGLAIRLKSADPKAEPELWQFAHAPRYLRAETIEVLPGLLGAMVRATDAATERVSRAAERAREMLAGIRGPQK